MRKELEASAKKHKHSLSQEAQFHLQQSLLKDRNPRDDIVALTEAIAIAIREVERITDVKWRDSAFTTAAVRRAVDSLLCHFGAPGTPKVPPAIKKHADYADSDSAKVGQHAASQLIIEIESRGIFGDEGDPLNWDPGPAIGPHEHEWWVPYEWWRHRTIFHHLGSGWKRRGQLR